MKNNLKLNEWNIRTDRFVSFVVFSLLIKDVYMELNSLVTDP